MINKASLLFVLFIFFLSHPAFSCSPYIGQASINEVYVDKTGNTLTDGMFEIKILDEAINNGVYDDWSIAICANRKQGNSYTTECLSEISVSALNDGTFPWLYLDFNDTQSSFLDFGEGFDAQLKDDNGDVIDYIQVNGYGEQSLSCSVDDLPYVYSIPATQNGTVLIERTPDGTGGWVKYNAANADPTPGANNDGAPAIDHYQIVHSSAGLTCEAQTVTIRACTNSDTSSCTESTEAVTLDFTATGSTTVSKAGINFTGSTDVSFNYTTAETVTLSLANATVPATSSIFCSDDAFNDSNCEMTFVDTGFRFLSNGSTGINNQISGKPSNIGYNNQTIEIQAIQTSPVTGACESVVVNQDIELAAQCTNPNSCSSALSVDNVAIPTTVAAPSSYQAVDVGFSGSDTAEIWLQYPDAGALTLFARYNIPVDGSPSDVYMEGQANFVVKPFGFYIDVDGNPAAQDASGSVFLAAGEEFNVEITAKQWQAADDTDEDGIPDIGADLSNNGTTPNFAGENVTLTHNLVHPALGNNPDLSDNTFTSFTNGADNKDIAWYEVGILSFAANLSDGDYLGAGDIEGNVPYVGRFTPEHYKQTVLEDGDLAGECSDDWVYTGQMQSDALTAGAIGYQTQPQLLITAYAKNATNVTQNFTIGDTAADNFMKLLPAGLVFFDGINDDNVLDDVSQNGSDNSNRMKINANWTTGTIAEDDGNAGSVLYTFSDQDHYVYVKDANSETGPFTAQIPLRLESITDSDSVTHGSAASDLTEAIATDIEVRFARLVMENTYGPETASLRVPMSVEQLNSASQFEVNREDNCTEISTASNELLVTDISLGNPMPTVSVYTESVQAGVVGNNISTVPAFPNYVYFTELVPQASNRGQVQLEYQSLPWLDYDWDQDNNFDNNPTAVATFGLYRGNDRIIQWREITPTTP